MQAARNYHAMLAARALGRLAGLLQGALASAPCPAAREALSALLTPALAAQLANPDPKPLLMHLNSSLLNPQARWIECLQTHDFCFNNSRWLAKYF